MRDIEENPVKAPLADEYGNVHQPTDELARGGQGVVFRTADADLAIKQPLDESSQLDRRANLRDRFRHIRLLPIPARIPVSLPLAILRDQPGYVMRLLNGMRPFTAFDLDGKARKALEDRNAALPQWLSNVPERDRAWRLLHYAATGATRQRLFALAKCAAILARLHSAGLVYGDVSPHNTFIGDGAAPEVWLIDADNLRFELSSGGGIAFTPHYGAPEIVRDTDASRPRTDCWAFAVMAFKMLAMIHPFIGRKVEQPEDDEGGWDKEPAQDGRPAELDKQAYAGYFPFIDDEDDDSNASSDGLPRALVATPALRSLFQATFNAGRLHPHRRPAMAFWALELARACDRSLACAACGMTHFAHEHTACPYCGAAHPPFVHAKTSRWDIVLPASATEVALPHRLFYPFSFEHNDDTAYEAVLDFSTRTVAPVRGTQAFPDDLTFEFVGSSA